MIFNKIFFNKLGFTPKFAPSQGREQQLRGMQLQEKQGKNDKKDIGKLIRNSP